MSTPRNPDGQTGGGGGGGGGGSRSEDDPYPGPSQEPTPGLSEEYADVFDCRALEVSCHITKWFHSLVVSILEPLFGWIATRMFATPGPTEGIANIWHGTLVTVNILYALLVLAVAFVVMAHHSLQAQYGAKELLPRLVFGWVAANVSLTVVSLAASVSTAISEGIVSSGINSRTAAQNLRENASRFLEQEAVAVVLFLVVFIILFVVWLVVEIIRIVIVILLMVGGPLMLAFHTLPHTNRVAQMWWRALGAVMLVPIAQAIAYVALTRAFFEGDTKAIFGMSNVIVGDASLLDLVLLLVLVYVQIRIPMWAYKAVWTPPTGSSPIASLAKTAAAAVVVGAVTGGTGSATAAVSSRANSMGRSLLRRPNRVSAGSSATSGQPRRVRSWRFGKPGTHHTSSQTRHHHTTVTRARPQAHPNSPNQPGRRAHTTAPPDGRRTNGNRPSPQPIRTSPSTPSTTSRAQGAAATATAVPRGPRTAGQPGHRQPGNAGQRASSGGSRPAPKPPEQPSPSTRGQVPQPHWRRPTTWMPRFRRSGARRRPRQSMPRWRWRS